jgi:hypothetical protein
MRDNYSCHFVYVYIAGWWALASWSAGCCTLLVLAYILRYWIPASLLTFCPSFGQRLWANSLYSVPSGLGLGMRTFSQPAWPIVFSGVTYIVHVLGLVSQWPSGVKPVCPAGLFLYWPLCPRQWDTDVSWLYFINPGKAFLPSFSIPFSCFVLRVIFSGSYSSSDSKTTTHTTPSWERSGWNRSSSFCPSRFEVQLATLCTYTGSLFL